jgi:exopolysaccharide biosynthesis polyprenyl glycosylphosphotransferase
MLALADAVAVFVAILAVTFFTSVDVQEAFWAALFLPVWLVLAKLSGLYDRDHTALRHLTVDELPALCLWALGGTGATALILLYAPPGALAIGQAVLLWLIAVAAAFALRTLARFAWRRLTPPEVALVLGDEDLVETTRRRLAVFPDIHVRALDANGYSAEQLVHEPDRLDELGVDRIVLATKSINEELVREMVALCKRHAIKLSLVPAAAGMFASAVRLAHVADLRVVEYNTWDVSRSTLFLKRTMDVTLSLAALGLLSPVFLLVAVATLLDSGRPILFAQRRAGLNGKPFRMLKFRTMVADAEARLPQLVSFDALSEPMFKLPDDPRVTRLGRLLRRASVDELPQLWNVLRGDMSLVGTRPEQVEIVEKYTPAERFRLVVKPGVTGPMQVYGRGHLTFDERLAVERDYIENLSLARDIRLLALTVKPVVTGRGAF